MIPSWIENTKGYLGRFYDAHYDFENSDIYCSELLYYGWQDTTQQTMGRLVVLGELNWRPYEKTIKKYEGEGRPVPLGRKMIIPRELARAPQLGLVYHNGI